MKIPFLFLVILTLLSCREQRSKTIQKESRSRTEIAQCFEVKDSLGKPLILIKNPKTQLIEYQYWIEKPVETIACQSTTHLPYLKALGLLDRVIGAGNLSAVLDQEIKTLVDNNQLQDISDALELDEEKIIELNPQFLMVYPFAIKDIKMIKNAGIDIIFNTDYQENTPLGRAEWIKFYGALFHQEAKADSIFETIKENYHQITEQITQLPQKNIHVFTADQYNSRWYMPGKNSYLAILIQDAGGNFIGENQSTGSINIDQELAISYAFSADKWIKVSASAKNLQQIRTEYEIIASSKMIEQQEIIQCNTSAVDYFGQAALEPDIILKDFAKAFYPKHFKNHQPVYFFPFLD